MKEKLIHLLKTPLNKLKEKLNKVFDIDVKEIYKYEEVLAYFHAEKSKVSNFKNTALLVEKEKDFFLLQLVFLDQNMQVITGQQIKAKQLDEDLSNILNGKNMVIFS